MERPHAPRPGGARQTCRVGLKGPPVKITVTERIELVEARP